MGNKSNKGILSYKKTLARFISFLMFTLVCFFLVACGSEANSVSKTPSVPTPTPRPVATLQKSVRNVGDIGAVVGSTIAAFIRYFHRQADDYSSNKFGTDYLWMVPDVGILGTTSDYDVVINKDGIVTEIDIIFTHLAKIGACAAFIPKDGKIQGAWKKGDLAHIFAIDAPYVAVTYQSNVLSKLPPEDFPSGVAHPQINAKRGSATVDIATDKKTYSHCSVYLGTP